MILRRAQSGRALFKHAMPTLGISVLLDSILTRKSSLSPYTRETFTFLRPEGSQQVTWGVGECLAIPLENGNTLKNI